MSVQAAGQAGNPASYAEVTGRGSYVPADDEMNAGRALVEKNQETAAAKPDAATKRNAWAAKAKDNDIKAGQNTQKVGNGITAAAGTVATVGGIIIAGSATIPVFGWIAAAVELVVVVVVATLLALAGQVVSAIGRGMEKDARGEKSAHLDEVSTGLESTKKAAESAKTLKKENQIKDVSQKQKDLKVQIEEQERIKQGMDPQSMEYKRAQGKLDRMNKIDGQYTGRLSKLQGDGSDNPNPAPSGTAEGTHVGMQGAPSVGSEEGLAMDANSAAEGVPDTGSTAATDVASNPSGTSTAPASSTSPSTTTTAAPPP